MAWFRVDDQFGTNPKVMQIPRSKRKECLGAWLLAGVWSAQHLTDGRVPEYMLEELGTEVSQRDALVTVGLWEETGDGIAFKDWADYQPSRADVHARREADRRRKEEWRRKKGEKQGQSHAVTDASRDADVRAESALPDPARPDPAPIREEPNGSSLLSDSFESNADGELLPDNWMPSQKQYDHAMSLGLDPQQQLARFREHALRNQRRQKNWNTAFTNWLKKGAELSQQRQTAGQTFPSRQPQPSRADEAQDFIQRLEALDATRGSGEAAGDHPQLR